MVIFFVLSVAFVCDSHDHLFFSCEYSMQLLNHFCNKMGIIFIFDHWNDLVNKYCNLIKGKSSVVLIRKLVLAGCVAQ